MKLRKIFSFLILLLFISCNQDIKPPLIITGEVTDISTDGAKLHAYVTSLGDAPIQDYGFVWDYSRVPTIEKSEKIILTSGIEKGSFNTDISFGLMPNQKYTVRAFIRNEEFTTYGEAVHFYSLGSKEKGKISSFSPKVGNLLGEIVIYGERFSLNNINVFINNLSATILQHTTDSIRVRVPEGLNKEFSHISVKNLGFTITAKDSFALYKPVIHKIIPETINFGEEVIIQGANFKQSPKTLVVYANDVQLPAQIIDDNNIKVKIPIELNTDVFLSVKMNNLLTIHPEKLQISPIEITNFEPKTILTGNSLKIYGHNFHPIAENNVVYIGGVKTKATSLNGNVLSVEVPVQDTVIYPSRNVKVEVETLGVRKAFSETLLIDDKWFRNADLPENMENYYSFVINGIAYLGLNNTKNLWAFNPQNKQWVKKLHFRALQDLMALVLN